jgi:hypothetical protein
LASGSGPISYQWTKDGADIPGATNSTLSLVDISAADAATYCAVVSGPCNSVVKCGTLTVLTLLDVAGPFSVTNCPDATASFSVLTRGSAGSSGFTYQWSKDGTNIEWGTNADLVLTNINASDAGSYCVLVTGPCNSISNCATLTVLTPLSLSGPTDQTNCPGTSATFSVAAFGSGPFSYQWSKDQVEIGGATSSNLVLENVSPTDTGNYCVVVRGPCDVLTNCAFLTVPADCPTLGGAPLPSALTLLREGDQITISWPCPCDGFVLEAATSLNPANWQPVDTTPVISTGIGRVTLPADQPARFFRLRQK